MVWAWAARQLESWADDFDSPRRGVRVKNRLNDGCCSEAGLARYRWSGETKRIRERFEQYGPFDFIVGSDVLYSRGSYQPLLSTITYFSEPYTRTWLACPERDAGLGEGYGGRYFAAVASGHLSDEDVARSRKLEHTTFGTERRFKSRVLVESRDTSTFLIELLPVGDRPLLECTPVSRLGRHPTP